MKTFIGVGTIFLLVAKDWVLFSKVDTPVFIFSVIVTLLTSIVVGYYSFKKEV